MQFGNVEEVEIITDKATGKKRGFAFVTYDDYDPVDRVVCEFVFFSKSFFCIFMVLFVVGVNKSKFNSSF